MKRIVPFAVLSIAVVGSGAVLAKADCKAYPKNEWMNAGEAKAKIQSQGYTIKKFKVDGNCYEIYGFDKDGKKVEIYFDAKTLAPVKTEVSD
ncbi:MAG: PepSY domain-containing protein [Ideonella sp.]|nr:PepSY domain-containing protein [Ideonella sp.]MCC7455791.1 PepSY domain-containing protein [Nitrospira sp.]